jgi:phosphoesterase RecJ-like protein
VCERSAGDAFDEVVRRLASAGRLLILTHARPDGDALGAMAALASAARAAGKSAAMLLDDDVPGRYAFLFPRERPAGAGELAALADEADVVVVLDTCAFSQLGGLAEALGARRGKVVVIDHHATADEVGDVQWLDPAAAAAGVMVAELIEALGWPLDAQAAEALLTAITTDTGWFRHANTDGRCLRAAARLLDPPSGQAGAGIAPDELYQRLYQSDRPERMQLLRRALASLELHQDGRIAVMKLRASDFAETRARRDETEDFVNEPLRMGCVEVSVLLAAGEEAPAGQGPPLVRASLRSRRGVDVSAIARRFGGGGHARAAGLRRAEDIDTLAQRLIEACAESL